MTNRYIIRTADGMEYPRPLPIKEAKRVLGRKHFNGAELVVARTGRVVARNQALERVKP